MRWRRVVFNSPLRACSLAPRKKDADDNWTAYLMQPVGKMSLRDYLFQTAPKLHPFSKNDFNPRTTLYKSACRQRQSKRVGDYLEEITSSLEKLRNYASFTELAPYFDDELVVNRVQIPGPRGLVKVLTDRWKNGDPR